MISGVPAYLQILRKTDIYKTFAACITGSILSLLLFATPSFAAAPLLIGTADSYPLGGVSLEVLEDPGRSLTIADVSSPRFADRFAPARHAIPNFGMSDSAFWFRFTIDAGRHNDKNWLLYLNHPTMEQADLYQPLPDGRFQTLYSGIARPIQQRPLPERNIVFPLKVTGSPQTLYLRTWVQGRAQMPLTVLTDTAMRKIVSDQQFYFGLYSGLIFCTSLAGLFMFLMMQDRSYLYFVLYILGLFLSQLWMNGFIYLHIPQKYLAYHYYLLHTAFLVARIAASLFADNFLMIRLHSPRISVALKCTVVVSVLLIPLPFFVPALISKHILAGAMLMSAPVPTLAAIVSMRRNGFKIAGYYLLSRLVLNSTIIFVFLVNNGYIFESVTSFPLFMFVSPLEVLLISLAFSERFRITRRQLATTMSSLEDEIRKRSEINEALKEQMFERIQLEREIVSVSDEERRKISHELHDGLCQELAGARLYYTAMEGDFSDAGIATKEVRQLGNLLDKAVNHAYDLSRGLWPLEHDGKLATVSLNDLVQRLTEQSGIRIKFHHTQGCQECDESRLTQVHRIAREALGNAVKHSHATEIVISLVCDPLQGITTQIRDNGIGRQASAQSSGGLGLGIMAHRAAVIGGSLEISDGKNGGTVVSCSAPCSRKPSKGVMSCQKTFLTEPELS